MRYECEACLKINFKKFHYIKIIAIDHKAFQHVILELDGTICNRTEELKNCVYLLWPLYGVVGCHFQLVL